MKRLYLLLSISLIRQIDNHVVVEQNEMSPTQHDIIRDVFIPENQHFTPAPKHMRPALGRCTDGAECVNFVSCPAHVRMASKQFCEILGGSKGICCKSGQNHTDPSKDQSQHPILRLDIGALRAVCRKVRQELMELRSREIQLLLSRESTILHPGSASYSHYRNSRRFNTDEMAQVSHMASRAMEIAIATRAFKEREGISNTQLELGMIDEDLSQTPLGHNCVQMPLCPISAEKYRRIDGSCNNRLYPNWGIALSPYSRLLPPDYQDGIWTPRTSKINSEVLPSPRLISTTIFYEKDVPNNDYTLLLMQFGQLLSHEITQSLDFTFDNGSAISCCLQDGTDALPIQHRHYACMPIEIPGNDQFFGVFNQRCMNFVRSILSPRHDCSFGYAQQMNKVTHFIDGSSIYGSTPEQTGELRSFDGGRLKVFYDFGRELLPLTKDADACLTMERGSACFTSGDTRTNQMITLVVMHTIFLREHNRVAGILQHLNPHWNDERLFWEARQIVVAKMQVVVYKEFLPTLLGDLTMEEFDLHLAKNYEYSFEYDERVEPSVINEFAAAAYRFGHSMVNGLLKIYGPTKTEEMIFIPEIMFYPSRMRMRTFLDEALTTLTTEPIQDVDESLTEALTNYMFRGGNPYGVDLAAFNIQRGRDHGLRAYNDYRELVGMSRYTSFEHFGPNIGNKLSSLYKTVDDVDLWVGGLLEEKAAGSILGQTFKNIIAEQFSRLKKGDRYFFENAPNINPGYFSPDQLFELRKASMSRLICDNSDGILLARQASNAFRKPGVPG
ncbi:hypothetical protein NQ315_012127 [Exocentrus adspersus]|uniref:Chorion peroxidase n=1 Tax=Exocentrus adspersus TaxID=1586481 RepID=A0AAV8VXP3_9CUCU|nr:hypothetical protein NQ315_012127 [Exocentrus adspersus]